MAHRPRSAALAMALAATLGGCSPSPAPLPEVPPTTTATTQASPTPDPTSTAAPSPSQGVQRGVVRYVFDGDTVEVTGVGKVRMVGIDAPELGACGHKKARKALAKLVLDKKVTLVQGGADEHDRYGRPLRYVDVGSKDAGLAMVKQGWAIARYDSRDGYGRHTREDAYRAADKTSEDLGCYSD